MGLEPEMRWPDAIATLAHERTLAEAGVALLKKHGSPADVTSGYQKYSAAKAEYDAIIGGLTVALAQNGEPETLDSLEQRMRRAFDLRQQFSNDVNRLIPPQLQGRKGFIADAIEGVIKGALEPVLDAVKAIWFRHLDDSAMRRMAIQTQLSATKWADFSAIGAAPD